MKIMIVGLGLIGGSFAKAIKQKTENEVIGLDLDPETLEKALACGAIDRAVSAIEPETKLVLLALFPKASVSFAKSYLHEFPEGCTVIDLCGVKRAVCGELEPLLADRGVTFIGGHPMAGREHFGFDASLPSLYEGASMILTPREGRAPQWIEAFFLSLGFSRITYTTPERHDELIALTSQLAHIVSSAYIQNPSAEASMGFSAGSFHDMTRVAKLNEDMWSELFLLNPDYLSQQIGQLIEKLSEFKTVIEHGEREPLRAMLREGRERKEAMLRERG